MEINAFHSLLQLYSPSFSTERINQYALCLKPCYQTLEAIAFDLKKEAAVYYERFSLSKNFSFQEGLPQVAKHHAFLGSSGWKTVVLMESLLPCVQVPADAFEFSLASELLKLHISNHFEPIQPAYTLHASLKLINVFACSGVNLQLLQTFYSGIPLRQVHMSDAILAGLLSMPERLDYRYLHLFVHHHQVTIAFFRAGRLYLLNTFTFDTPEDLLYYVLFAVFELGLDKKDTELLVWGDIGASFSGRLSILQEYFPLVSFGTRPKGIRFDYQFGELEEHAGFEMFSTYHLIHQ
ncbi:MAG: DUF3822 family protein [Cytophagales bacterium]|nr:DUF3822 family protein [Bernardetiaceae bacterium]MDW8211434.1 DUF3822 family protein [Cytophagales bacterium]